MTDQRVGSLRIITALAVVAAVVAAGWLHRSPWTIALATPTFTALYALGKWNAWTAAWRAGGVRQVALALLVTLPIQAIVAGVCYLIGLGLGTLFAGDTPIAALSLVDVVFMVALLAVGVAAGAAIIRLEGHAGPISERDRGHHGCGGRNARTLHRSSAADPRHLFPASRLLVGQRGAASTGEPRHARREATAPGT